MLLQGCFGFTSSQAAFFPSPGGTVYSAGKAFISAFVASFAIEARRTCSDFYLIYVCPTCGTA